MRFTHTSSRITHDLKKYIQSIRLIWSTFYSATSLNGNQTVFAHGLTSIQHCLLKTNNFYNFDMSSWAGMTYLILKHRPQSHESLLKNGSRSPVEQTRACPTLSSHKNYIHRYQVVIIFILFIEYYLPFLMGTSLIICV